VNKERERQIKWRKMKHDRGRAIHRVRERESLGTGLDFDVLSGRHRKRISSRYMPRARVCPYPLCDSVIDVTFLVHRCVSVCTEIHAQVRESTERQTCGFGSTQQDLGTYRARIDEATERGRSRTWEVIDVRLWCGWYAPRMVKNVRLTRLTLVQSVDSMRG